MQLRKKLSLKLPNNRSEPQSSHKSQQKQENIRWTGKISEGNDFSSVIEEVRDSIGSGEDLLREFQQYGIKIENIEANEQSEDNRLRTGTSRFSNNDHLVSSKRHSQFDTVLDYSNMAKIKEKQSQKSQRRIKYLKIHAKLKFIDQCVKQWKNLITNTKGQIYKNMQETKKHTEELEKQTLSIICSLKQQEKTKIRKLNQKVELLQKKLDQTQKQKQQVCDQNKILSQQKKNLKQLIEKNQIGSTKQSLGLKTKLAPNQYDFLSQSRRLSSDLELEYKKQSQVLKTLNAEIQELTQQVTDLKAQNKQLRLKNKEIERKLMDKTKTSNSIENYNKFLEKIKQLQEQINFMKQKQERQKQNQGQQWREQIKNQLQEIDQFLIVCDQRQRDLVNRERQIQKKQLEIKKHFEVRHKQHYDEEQFESPVRKQSRNIAYKSPLKTSSTKLRFTTQPNLPYTDKLVKFSSPSTYDLYSNRPSMGSRNQLSERPSFYRNQSKNSDQLSSRLNKISSCIENQLYSLGCRN